MFHLLVVDDDRPTREELKKLLEEEWEGTTVRTAGTVKEGTAEINRALDLEIPFDAVILDFRLPAARGHANAIDETQCRLIRRKMPDTFVVHITGHPQDETVLTHMREFHYFTNSLRDPISKLEIDYGRILCDTLATTLHRVRIERQYNQVAVSRSSLLRGRNSPGTMIGSSTHNLGALMRDISQHWKYLDVGQQDRLRDTFDIQDDKDPVHVTFKVAAALGVDTEGSTTALAREDQKD